MAQSKHQFLRGVEISDTDMLLPWYTSTLSVQCNPLFESDNQIASGGGLPAWVPAARGGGWACTTLLSMGPLLQLAFRWLVSMGELQGERLYSH